MDSLEFLTTILPEDGYYCLARPHPKGFFVHRVFEKIEDMAQVAAEMDAGRHEVYYAIASLKRPAVWDPNKNNGKGGHSYRTKGNILCLKAVFFEADVLRPEELEEATEADLERKYTSQADALEGIKAFARQIGWPLPTVVNSGWGFHFYWPLTEAVEPSEYELLVRKLKLASRHFKFKLDVSAADVSRVFRVPGTHNNKRADDRKRVTVLRSASPVAFQDLEDALDDALAGASISVGDMQPRIHLPDYLNFGPGNLREESEPLQFRSMMEKCGAMRECLTHPNEVSYHTWYRTIQVVRHCEDGESLVHKVSALADSYSEGETDKMLRGLIDKDIPPTLCEKFSQDSDACATCPFRGKIKSPAALGRPAKLVRESPALVMHAEVGTMPPPPHPFKLLNGAGVVMEKTDREGNTYDEVIFGYDLVPVKRLFSEREDREVIQWKTCNPADGSVLIEMPSSALYDKRAFATALADEGVYPELRHVDALRQYMIVYTQEAQKVFRREYQFGRLGWRDNLEHFVLGQTLYTSEGASACNTEHHNRVMKAVASHGDLEGWKGILRFLDGPEFAGHQFGLGIGFGSLLMPFTGISGGIVNMTGWSGEGKSTVQKIVNSIWGHPIQLMLPADTKSSTYNAKISFINIMNSLPICAEEITNATPDEVGALAYAINQGSEKWRANIQGEVRDSKGGWCTIMLASANSSLHSKLEGQGGAAAKALRVFEYPLPKVRKHSKTEFQEGVDLQLLEHYGVAGPVYVSYLLTHFDEVKQLLRDTMVRVDRAYALTPEERVWSAVLACGLTGLEVARRAGLHEFDTYHAEAFVQTQLKALRHSVDRMDSTPIEVLSEYLAANIRNMLVIDSGVMGGKRTDVVVQKPFGSLDIRYETHSGKLILAGTPFRKWCIENNHPHNEVINGLRDAGMVVKRSAPERLGRGTDYETGQVRAMILDATVPAFSGGLRAVRNSIEDPLSGVRNVIS